MTTFPMKMRFYFYNDENELKIVQDEVKDQCDIDEAIEYIKTTFGVSRVIGRVK